MGVSKKGIKVSSPHGDGSVTVKIPQGDKCVICGGDGYMLVDPPIKGPGWVWVEEENRMVNIPDITGSYSLQWCPICRDYHCLKCSLCK